MLRGFTISTAILLIGISREEIYVLRHIHSLGGRGETKTIVGATRRSRPGDKACRCSSKRGCRCCTSHLAPRQRSTWSIVPIVPTSPLTKRTAWVRKEKEVGWLVQPTVPLEILSPQTPCPSFPTCVRAYHMGDGASLEGILSFGSLAQVHRVSAQLESLSMICFSCSGAARCVNSTASMQSSLAVIHQSRRTRADQRDPTCLEAWY